VFRDVVAARFQRADLPSFPVRRHAGSVPPQAFGTDSCRHHDDFTPGE